MKKSTKSQTPPTLPLDVMFDQDPTKSEERMKSVERLLEQQKQLKSNIVVYQNREICAFSSEERAFYGRARRKDQKRLKDSQLFLSLLATSAFDPKVAAVATAALAE